MAEIDLWQRYQPRQELARIIHRRPGARA
jgi:hypothetical protein